MRRALIFLALFGCEETPPAKIEVPRPPAVSAKVEAPPPPPATVVVESPLPTNADPERVAIAKSICRAVWKESSGSTDIGCLPDEKSNGSITKFADEDPLNFCGLSTLYPGSFTKPGAKEIFVYIEACPSKDESWDIANPGRAVIVEKAEGGYTQLKEVKGVHAGNCQLLTRSTKLDALVCKSNLHAPPAGDMQYVFTMGYDGAHTIARFFADDASCMMHPDGDVKEGIVDEQIKGVTVKGQDVAIEIERARVAPSAALNKQVQAICTVDPGATYDKLLPAKKTKIRLEFTGKGESLVPTPATKKQLDTIKVELLNDYNGMRGAAPDNGL